MWHRSMPARKDGHGKATVQLMYLNIHVNGLQDGRRVVLRPSDIVRTPFFVVARHHRQSVPVDCFSCVLITTEIHTCRLGYQENCAFGLLRLKLHVECIRIPEIVTLY